VLAALITLGLLTPAGAGPAEGTIGGRVVDAARGDAPAAGADVYLQVRLEDRFEVIAHAQADPEGRFLFEGLPLDPSLVYLPGAGRDGVVYPGPRVTVSPERPAAGVVLRVSGAAGGPSPLVLRRFEAVLTPGPGALRVAETLEIENPTAATYIGDGEAAPTLRLHVPPEFERITFAEEFHGRQFTIRDRQPETSLPWTPGRRTLRYTYVVPDDGSLRAWTRPLDLPCDAVSVVVHASGATSRLGDGVRDEAGATTFAATGPLPAGHALRVDLGRTAAPGWLDARWITLAGLALAIAATSAALARARRRAPAAPTPAPHARRAGRPARAR
jgi:hypothetical protein